VSEKISDKNESMILSGYSRKEMGMNPWTLSFAPAIEEEFLDFYVLHHLRSKRRYLIIGIIIYALFGFMDANSYPDLKHHFWFIRYAVVCPAVAVVIILTYFRMFRKYIHGLLAGLMLITGGGIIAMNVYMEAPSSYHAYPGLILSLLFSYTYVRLRFTWASAAGLLLVLTYEYVAIRIIELPLYYLVTNNFFILTANCIGMMACYSMEYHVRRYFYLTRLLDIDGKKKKHDNLLLAEKALEKSKLHAEASAQLEKERKTLRLSQESFSQEKGKLEAILTAVTDGLTVQDTSFKVLYQNDAHRELFGDIAGGYCYVAYAQRDAVCDNCPLKKSMTDGGKYKKEIARKISNGEERFFDISASPVKNEQGLIIGGIEVFRDVTEQKKLSSQLLQAQKMESIGRLAGGVAHDFNNLLTGMIGFTGLVLEEIDEDSPIYDDIVEIGVLSKKAADLTRQLLAFSRQQPLEPVEFDPNRMVLNLSRMLKRLIGEDIYFETRLNLKKGVVYADPGQIEQVLINLVVNARDAMPAGGSLTISTSEILISEDESAQGDFFIEPGLYVLISVSDSGSGIDPAIKDHIFEPFFTTKDIGEGTGLGLSTVFGIIKQHNGYIRVDSHEGGGTVFNIYLPHVTGYEKVSLLQAADKSQENDEKKDGMVLLVEDEESVRRVTLRLLEKIGYNVIDCKGGQEALKILQDDKPKVDLLLTDIIMPGMNGQELFKKVSAYQPDLKVLFMSGYSHSSGFFTRRGTSLIDGPFISKPFTSDTLGMKIQQILAE
jgi:signal transduction histidine kinase/CheY-like chemotaxis protein